MQRMPPDFMRLRAASMPSPGQPAALSVQEEGLRPADGAAVRLRVVAPVFNVLKLCLAVRAHRKLRHGGVRPVIGDGFNNRESRSAVGAVYEGVAIPPVGGVEQLAQAVRADARVRRNERPHTLTALARDYAEALKVLSPLHGAGLHGLDERQRAARPPSVRPETPQAPAPLPRARARRRLRCSAPSQTGRAPSPACARTDGTQLPVLFRGPLSVALSIFPNNVNIFTFVAINASHPVLILTSGILFVNKLTSSAMVVIAALMC